MELKLLDNRKCPCGEGTDITSELEAQAKVTLRQVVEMFDEAPDYLPKDAEMEHIRKVIEQLREVAGG